MNKLEARVWANLTEERLILIRDTVLWPNRKLINTIVEASMSHSDPYPKMPWESGNSGGSHRSGGGGGGGQHRDPSGARASRPGCGMVAVPVVTLIGAILVIVAFVL